ncbi:hypothetical protein OGATHE_001197 [Ogataea polymorpha]|uniref:Uncharacterized protein n=1 Tax=Ogataea polymorpha TaxID=460523 RepID=A0A9P8PQT3_9ASCO|nr:hypothetical protein OGATHE_001197 [Ogataea polymorpha]
MARPIKLATTQELISNTEEYRTDRGEMINCRNPMTSPIPNEIGMSIQFPPNPHGVTMAEEKPYKSTQYHWLKRGLRDKISSSFPLASSTPIRSWTTSL